MEVDQAAIDEILASAEADTPESRIDKLEKELDVLKGSVKKLLLDLRETLNNLENPFQNLQNLAEGALPAMHQQPPVQQIQVVPAQVPEPKPPEPEESEKKSEEEIPEEPEIGEEEDFVGDLGSQDYGKEVVPEEGGIVSRQVEVYEGKKEKAAPKAAMMKKKEPELFIKYDIETLFNLMEWVKGMLEKYTIDSLRIMLEIFESAGYISDEAKDFVVKIAELIALNDGFEDMLLELYRLHKLMNPGDTSMDSKLLNLKLEKKL